MKSPLILLAIFQLTCGNSAFAATADNPDTIATVDLLGTARSVIVLKSTDTSSEKTLEQVVLTLATRAETPAARTLMEDLSKRIPTVLVAHDEGGALIPLVDVGAAARVTLRTWDRVAAKLEASRQISAGDPALLQDYFSADKTQQAGIIDAINLASSASLVLFRDESLRQIKAPGGDQLVATLAKQLADTTLYEMAITTSSAPVALATIRQLSDDVDADTALSLLRLGLNRSDIGSAALFEIGRLTSSSPAANKLLWEYLGDQQLGGSAAAVLASHADNATINRLTELLVENNTGNSASKQRIVLALKLTGDPHARRIADQWLVQRSMQSDGQ